MNLEARKMHFIILEDYKAQLRNETSFRIYRIASYEFE